MPKYFEMGKKEIYNQNIIGKPSRPIFVCEGIFDTLTILQAGFEAVCLCSTQGINTFIEYLKENKPQNNLILLLDDDSEGQEATKKLIDELKAIDIIYNKNPLLKKLSEALKHNFKDINEIISYSGKTIPLLNAYLKKAEEYASESYFKLFEKISYSKIQRKKQ